MDGLVGTGDRHRGICPQDNTLICGVVLRIDGDENGMAVIKLLKTKEYILMDIEMFKVLLSVQVLDAHYCRVPWHNDEITG